MARKGKIATLTGAENHIWEKYWFSHIRDGKQGQDEAARRAWRDLRKEFSRLQEYDNCR